MQRLLKAKFTINQPGDASEREADRVAIDVIDGIHQPESAPSVKVSASAPAPLRRTCACGGSCPECQEGTTRNRTLDGESSLVGSSSGGSAIVEEALRSPGQPLDAGTRAFMEPRFGSDFGEVRVHTGTEVAESTQAVNALAFTVGHDIVFGPGQYAPQTGVGRKLLAHELAHVVEQDGGAPKVQRKPASEGDCPEREPGEEKASASSPFRLVERSPKREWLIFDFRVGSSTIDPAKGDAGALMGKIVKSLMQGHFFYMLGQDPLEILGYSDCAGKPSLNEHFRTERAANFCGMVRERYSMHPDSARRLTRSCRAAHPETYVASNATQDGRSQNRSVLIRVLPPTPSTSPYPYDETYGPTAANCDTYLAVGNFLSPAYADNAYCACTNTPDEPHNNCVRKCLQSKLWTFIAAHKGDLEAGRFIWCPSIWMHHRQCYQECGCDNDFIDYLGFYTLCETLVPCEISAAAIALLNRCMRVAASPP